MHIAIIDADLIGRKRHRFPNLTCEKISAYWKDRGADVELKLNYNDLNTYDQVFIAKVFTDTPVPNWLIATEKIHLGGTGFFFDQAPPLPKEVEHYMPDYTLYDRWIQQESLRAREIAEHNGNEFNLKRYMAQFKEYTDYSIGFITRGCFRKCKFCVNQKYNQVFLNSPLDEFYDNNRKKICLLDDNFLGYSHWKELLNQLKSKNRPFKFKQGLDERLLTDEKCDMLFSSRYDGDYTFAFDKIEDYDLIHSKLAIIRKYTRSTSIKFYVLVGFDSTDAVDIENAFKRIKLLMQFQCLPYIMRYQNRNYIPWKESHYREMYVSLARWSNQPNIFKKMSFRQFCLANQLLHKTQGSLCSTMRAMKNFETEYPDIAKKYFDLRFENYKMNWRN